MVAAGAFLFYSSILLGDVFPMRIAEVAEKQKAGIIPYFVNKEGVARMLFMIPSNPAYGGSHPQIAKGSIDPGEDTATAAMREGMEELGLQHSNIVAVRSVGTERITGLDETYSLSLFAAKVKNPGQFSQPHYETGKRVWLSAEEFSKVGRKSQAALVKKAYDIIQQGE